jgi:3-oxoacyl-[acyl-carrier-protein] synthase II
MAPRVVVTGCGLATPAGAELDRFWSGITAGRSFVGPLRHFSCPGIDAPRGGETTLPADERGPEVSGGGEPYPIRCAHLASAAARRALADAGLRSPGIEGGVAVGTTMGEERRIGALADAWAARGDDALDGALFLGGDSHDVAAAIAREHGLDGPVALIASACSSGNAALALAYDALAGGAAELMVAGGSDTFTRSVWTGFQRLGALSKAGVCRPFDKRRDGVVFGEGAGMLVLETLEHARRRGARVLAEVAGYGMSNDAYHITAPEPTGEGFARAMRQALDTTGTRLDEVDYVSAHGTGTAYNDVAETKAMKAVFGADAPRVPISSIKSMIGHTNGAASAIEAVACTLAIVHQMVPPTANLEEPDPECDLDYVSGAGRARRVRTCLNLSAGFGGFNVCLVLKEIA